MAIQKDGPNGAFIGKVGSVFGYVMNGQNIIRGVRKKKKRKPSEAELLNRKKMKVAGEFMGMLYPVVRYGYKDLAPKGSRVGPVQMAQSHVLKECMELNDRQEPFVNPEKVLVFRGKLSSPQECVVEQDGDNLKFRWQINSAYNGSSYKLNVFIYEIGVDVDIKIAAVEANLGECVIPFPLLKNNKSPVHVYAGFVDALEGVLSDSVYLGVVG